MKSDATFNDEAVLERSNERDSTTDELEGLYNKLIGVSIIFEPTNEFDSYLYSSDSEHSVNPSIRVKKPESEIELFGEPFLLKKDNQLIHITHKRWSLSGSGNTITNALTNLKENAEILLETYSKLPENELANDAKEMLLFLRTIF